MYEKSIKIKHSTGHWKAYAPVVDGEIHGETISFFQDGSLYQNCTYQHGDRHGKCIETRPGYGGSRRLVISFYMQDEIVWGFPFLKEKPLRATSRERFQVLEV